MNGHTTRAVTCPSPVLDLSGTRAYVLLSTLVAAAAVLPALCHVAGAPVRWILPMHWPVLLAALVYGWRGGAAVGLLSPTVATLISGFPLPAVLPAMTAELFFYGLVAGLLREGLRWGGPSSVAAALISGRLVFIGVMAATTVGLGGLAPYLKVALLPGIPGAVAQVLLVPALAGWWVGRRRQEG